MILKASFISDWGNIRRCKLKLMDKNSHKYKKKIINRTNIECIKLIVGNQRAKKYDDLNKVPYLTNHFWKN